MLLMINKVHLVDIVLTGVPERIKYCSVMYIV